MIEISSEPPTSPARPGPMRTLRALLSAMPRGTVPVGAGLLVAGATTYAFLALSARVLGPTKYGSLSALWGFLFLIGPGAFVPFEQELGRAVAARRALGIAAGSVVARITKAIGVTTALLLVASVAANGFIVEEIFDDQILLAAAFAIGLVAYSGSHVVKGTLSGLHSFRTYGAVQASEGIARLVIAVGLALLGARSAGAFGLAVALAPLASLPFFPRRDPALAKPGPLPPWGDLNRAIGHLFVGSVFAALLVNAGPVAAKLLATEEETADVGRFLAALVVARVPLFMFQAVQVALLPRLSALAAAERIAEFRRGFAKLLAIVIGAGVIATATAVVVGPPVVTAVFGSGFRLTRLDLALLGGSTTGYIAALSFAQALIALGQHRRATWAWMTGCAVLAASLVPEAALLLRVERALFLGSLGGAVAMGVLYFTSKLNLTAIDASAEHDALVESDAG